MKPRDIIFWVHLIAGIAVGLVILIMSVTGTMLAFRPQIIDVAEHDIYKSVPSGDAEERLSLHDIKVKVKESYPDAKITGLSVKADPHAPMVINLGREMTLFINPYTGIILGQGSGARQFLEKVEVWHRWLGLEGSLKPLGHDIKGICNIIFFFMIVSGIYLWWPRNWRWNTLKSIICFNAAAKGKARDWNWHNVIGCYFAPLLLIVVVTGVIMSYQWANDLLYRSTGNIPPVISQKDGPMPATEGHHKEYGESGKSEGGHHIDLDQLLARAQAQVPQWTVISMRLGKSNAPVNIVIETKDGGFLPARSQLTLDASTAKVVKWEPAAEQNSGRKLRTFVRYLHTGEVFGVAGQLTAFVTALAAILLIWTGFAMAWYRFFLSKPTIKKSR